MLRYIGKRLLQAIPTVWGATLLAFAIVRFAPGNPFQIILFGSNAGVATQQMLEERHCLNRPIIAQYAVWMMGDWRGDCPGRGILRGDFGQSLTDQRPVLTLFMERLPATLLLTTTALIFGVTTGLLIGLLSAMRHNTWFDNLFRLLAVVFDALPSFWLGLICIFLFTSTLGWLPSGGRETLHYAGRFIWWDRLRHLILPAFVLSTGWIALFSRYMRAELLDVMQRDFVRTAHAKGLRRRTVYGMHVARNALLPIATLLGPAIASLLSGALIIETIFSWPGIGRMTFYAISTRNYPVIMASVLITALLVILGNLLSDLLYRVLDPKIQP